jgi:insulysin
MVKMEDILSANILINKFEPNLINEVLSHLKPELMKVFAVSKYFEGITDKTEKWYGTQYKTEKLDSKLLDELNNCGLNEALKLPLKNIFIPSDFTLIKHENGVDEFPVVIHKSNIKRLWYKGDDKFLLPKVSISFELKNPLAYFDPKNSLMTELFVSCMKDSLTEYKDSPNLAGLYVNISDTYNGIEVNSFYSSNRSFKENAISISHPKL